MQAFIALGSNLANPMLQVKNALLAIDKIRLTRVIKQSSMYQTAPIDCPQTTNAPVPDFINAVAEVKTTLSPEDLLEALHTIENTAGRERPYINAPRVIDCDLLLYENIVKNTAKLTLPHPRMHTRGFVLLPLFEIAPQLILPNHGKIARLITPSLTAGIQKIENWRMSIFSKFPYIVVEGPIGSGKTTLAKMLADKFPVDYLSEKAEANPFLPRFYQDAQRYALPTQLFFLFQRANQMKDLSQRDMFAKPIVADFFLEKDALFARLNLSDEEYALYHQIYSHLQLKAPKPDLVIYLQTPVDALAARIEERNVHYEQELPREYLERLSEAYSDFFHHYDGAPVLIVNNAKLNILKNPEALDLLIDRIGKISSQREFFNPNFE